jgi:hypothetical protein
MAEVTGSTSMLASDWHSSTEFTLSSFARRAGLVTLRQTFVRSPVHGGGRACPGVKDEQRDLFSSEF